MKPLESVNPVSLEEAINRLDADGANASVVGGGSDLLGMIKDDLTAPDVLINLRTIAGDDRLRTIAGDPDADSGIRIGALVTLAELARHPTVTRHYPVLAEAAASAATPQIRNVGTVGGNLCQRPWCWYFRQKFPCFKHGGNRCFSRAGENQFNAILGGGPSFIIHPSDTAPAFVALGASFHLVGPAGERVVPAGEFFTLPRTDVTRENVLVPGEVLHTVTVPPAHSSRSTYAKVLDREAWTHAVVSVAATVEMDGDVIRRAQIVLGGVAPIPWPVPAAEELLRGQKMTVALANRVGRLAVDGAQPLSKNAYKVTLTKNLVRRTLLSLTTEA